MKVYEVNNHYFIAAENLEQIQDLMLKDYDEEIDDYVEVGLDEFFWDSELTVEERNSLYDSILENEEIPENGDMWNLNIRGEIKEGTIKMYDGDYYITRSFKKALEGKTDFPTMIAERGY